MLIYIYNIPSEYRYTNLVDIVGIRENVHTDS